MINLLTGREVEKRLGVTYKERLKMASAMVLTPTEAGLYDAAAVARICSLPPFEPVRPSVIVRLSSPRRVEEPLRDWTGWSDDWPLERKTDAARMWWRISEPIDFIGGQLAAAVGPVVVATWAIRGAQRTPSGVVFDVIDMQPGPHGLAHLGPGSVLKAYR